MLDKMYELNLVYFKELTMYILAGRKAGRGPRQRPEGRAGEGQRTQLPEDARPPATWPTCVTAFEKKLYDLELTRNVSIQMGPQIRLIQSTTR